MVLDYGEFFSDRDEQNLESKLKEYNRETSTQISVVSLNDLGGIPIADYAVQLLDKWGVGQKGLDNGIVILVAKKERKAFIVTGYGVEDKLPDVIAKRIIDREMMPRFKKGQFYQGVDISIDGIQDRLTGAFSADDVVSESKSRFPWEILIALALFVLFVYFVSRNNKGKGGKGGGRKTYDDREVHRHPKPYRTGRNRGGGWGDFRTGRGVFGGGPVIFIPGGGGRSGGGRSSGGGSFGGGGGFGGFGGGSFGGGGAGGSW